MKKNTLAEITVDGKTLLVMLANFRSGSIGTEPIKIIRDVFEALVPYLHDTTQALYIRDIPIREKFPVGHCFNRHEIVLAVPFWPADTKQLRAAIAHEMHHLARWQNDGYGDTLGGAILSEGLATFYEELLSGWTPPWAQTALTNRAWRGASKAWNDKDYNHDAWFFNGPYGKWIGYSIGYQLAKKLYSKSFDLQHSIEVMPSNVYSLLIQETKA